MVWLREAVLISLVLYTQCSIKQNLDIDSMTGDEIAAMALEAKDNDPEDSMGTSFRYGLGKGSDPFEGMDIPDSFREEIEKAVKETMKKILDKAKTSKALRKVIRDELKKEAVKEDVDLAEMFGDFGWDVDGEEEDDEEEEEEEKDEFNETSYFQDELENDKGKEQTEESNEEKPKEENVKTKSKDEL